MNRDSFAAGHRWENKVKEVGYAISFPGADEVSEKIKNGEIVLTDGEMAFMKMKMVIEKTESPDPKFV